MMRGIVLGVLLTLVGFGAGAYWMISGGHVPANADATPGRLESWAAHTSLDATLAREAPKGAGPLASTPENLAAGMKIYADNCQVCHGGADAKASPIAQGLYQPAPQLAHHGVEDDPEGATFWKVAHGIRLTGMPSFIKTLSNDQLWQVTLFLKHMDALPPAVQRGWKSNVSKAVGG